MGTTRKLASRRTAKPAGRNGTHGLNGTGGPNGTADAGARDGLIEALSAPPGEQLFRTLARGLAVALNARIGFVSTVATAPGCVRLLAIWNGEEFGGTFEYPTEDTPCESVFGKKLVRIAGGVQRRYPKDAWLEEVSTRGRSHRVRPLFQLEPPGSCFLKRNRSTQPVRLGRQPRHRLHIQPRSGARRR